MTAGRRNRFAEKPRLLVLTSTFPRWVGDREPRFVFDLSRRLAKDFEVQVVAPHAPGAAPQEVMDGMRVHRFRYFPEKLQSLAYNGGILEKIAKHPRASLQAPFSSWHKSSSSGTS